MQIQSSAASFSNPAIEQVQKHQESKGCPIPAAGANFVSKCSLDQNFIRPIPGKPSVSITEFFQQDAKAIVEDTLNDVRHDHPFVSSLALQRFTSQLRNMTPGEIDDVKDAIVARLASPDSSQSDRDVLGKMYKLADSAAENRLPNFPKPRPMPHPFPIDPGFSDPMPKPMPRPWSEQPIQFENYAIGKQAN